MVAGVSTPPTNPAARPGASRRALALVLAASAALSLYLACTVPLVDPDEGRNAEIAREMSVSGDLVIPHLAGMPYLDKPPALFWAAAAAIRVAGPTRWAPRLPAVLASLLTLLALASLARRIGGDDLAWRAAALLAAAPLFAAISAYVIFDLPLALCVTLVWTLLARELAEGPSTSRRDLMFAAVTLGVLLKGPVMLIWALGGSGATALVMRRRSPLAWLAWVPGWVIVFGFAGGWFALATHRHPEYPRYAFLEESVERLTTRNFQRDQPWWFAFAALVGGALPWSLATPWRRTGRSLHVADSLARPAASTALGFLLFALVFFSLSHSKLVTYVVPALPPLALLAALAWSTVHGRARIVFAVVVLAVPIALVALIPGQLRRIEALSGEPLAAAIRAAGSPGHAPAVRYERCYSPGTDFLLGTRGILVSPNADQTTSVYQARYRESLRQRGWWTILANADSAPPAGVIVRPRRDDWPPPPGWVSFFTDARFTAYRPDAGPAAR
jgi:4-amino-4-deoxy-L-arabinose transferase-like glycosyltransferase